MTNPDTRAVAGSERLIDQMADRSFRHKLMCETVSKSIAYQIRALRERRGWDQTEFARQLGTAQTVISRYENPKYGKQSIDTLLRIAKLFDVALILRFVGWGEWLKTYEFIIAPDGFHVRQLDELIAEAPNGPSQ